MFDKEELIRLIDAAGENKDDHLIVIAIRVPADGSPAVGIEYANASEGVLKQALAAITTGEGMFAPYVDKFVHDRCIAIFEELKVRCGAPETVQ